MNRKFLRDQYEYFTGQLSSIIRSLGFAGIAVIWMFKHTRTYEIPVELIPIATWIVLGLGLDLLHYITGSIIWGIYNRQKELQGVSNDAEFTAPRQINYPAIILFWAKVGCIVIGYILLIIFLYNKTC